MKKIQINRVSLLTLSFLFSGNILYGLYYSSGNPIVSFLCISIFLLVYTFGISKFYASGKNISEKSYSRFFSVSAAVLAVIPLSYTVSVYANMLGGFAGYYSTVQVAVFAVLAAVIMGIWTARKGAVAVFGFARMTVWVMIVWVLAGFLGFFHTKSVVSPELFMSDALDTDFAGVFKNAVLIAFDTALLLTVLTDNKRREDKRLISHQMMQGVWIYIAVSGIDMLKNLLMFGSDFLLFIDNPDLAAIRLIPMFELPEISVMVNTFAVTTRVSVYLCAAFYMLKDSFGDRYSTKTVSTVCFFAVSAVSFVILYLKDRLQITFTAVLCIVMCTVFCMAFFSQREKR